MKPEIKWLSKGEPKILTHHGNEYKSGISKDSVEEIDVTFQRIIGDDVENHQYHGGPDRVVCVYPFEHYPFWEQKFGTELPHAAFGENLTVTGMKESQVCIGDIFRIGDTLLQVAQGRFPCVTINMHTHQDELLKEIFRTGYTGYFFRVLEEGKISINSTIELVKKHPLEVTVAMIHSTYFDDPRNLEKIELILSVEELALDWRGKLEKLKVKALNSNR
ncbi:MOSC domain-containing protein [Metabacillus herbersteinensis]|uniref:MOSC domain-containing protein n=1 Tax=Metabacillus herbersteinensis TaxID=283816 RepID=A0ABV6GFS0_9BACI